MRDLTNSLPTLSNFLEENVTEASNSTVGCSSNKTISLWIHVPVAGGIALWCLLGNLPLLWMYTRNKKIADKKLFQLSLAILDIIACILWLPLIAFIQGKLADQNCYINAAHVAVGGFCVSTYNHLDLSFAIDQFNVVYFPTTHKKRRLKTARLMIVTSYIAGIACELAHLKFTNSGLFSSDISYVIRSSIRFVVVSLTLTLYTAILYKLRKMKLEPGELELDHEAAIDISFQNIKLKLREGYVSVVKMFIAITTCYVTSETSYVIIWLFIGQDHLVYLAFFTNVSNPVIYFWLSRDFRQEYCNFWRQTKQIVKNCRNR